VDRVVRAEHRLRVGDVGSDIGIHHCVFTPASVAGADVVVDFRGTDVKSDDAAVGSHGDCGRLGDRFHLRHELPADGPGVGMCRVVVGKVVRLDVDPVACIAAVLKPEPTGAGRSVCLLQFEADA
jgi:hypothetical protein